MKKLALSVSVLVISVVSASAADLAPVFDPQLVVKAVARELDA